MKKENIQQLKIPQHAKQRSRSVVGLIYGVIAILLAAASWFAWPRSGDDQRILGETGGGREMPLQQGLQNLMKHRSCIKDKEWHQCKKMSQ